MNLIQPIQNWSTSRALSKKKIAFVVEKQTTVQKCLGLSRPHKIRNSNKDKQKWKPDISKADHKTR